jgi:hypothetical protein
VKSKTLAERAAWTFIALKAGGLELSVDKARCMLGWTPRSNEKSIIASAERLVRLWLLKGSPSKRSLNKS